MPAESRFDLRPFIARVEWTSPGPCPSIPTSTPSRARWGGDDFRAFVALVAREGRPGEFEGVAYR
jgi:hypothetical protein